jgi:hypothetical protein
MAIKVSGTTVINDSQGLTSIASIDSTTAAAIQAAGVGGGATTPTLSGNSALTLFDNTYTLTVSNYSSYTVPLFFYTITDNGGTLTATGNFTTSSTDISTEDFTGTAPWTIEVMAGDVSRGFSAAATKSVSDVTAVSARYWRIGLTADEGIGEWHLFSGRNATGTDHSPSSFLGNYAGYNTTYSRDKAHDDIGSTMWWTLSGSSSQGGNTLIYDFGTAKSVKSMTFVNFSPSYALGTHTTAGCTVASSTDNVTYTDRLTGIVTNDDTYGIGSPKVYGI